MTKTKFLSLFSILIIKFLVLNAQDTWVQSYAPFGSSEDKNYSVRNIAVCQDGGYAVNGSFRYELDESWIIEYGFLMKTDSDGNYLWARRDTVTFIEKTESYAFIETDDAGFMSAATNASIGGGNALIKRDSEGNREWVVDNDGFQVYSMAKINDGNIILAGRINSTPGIRKITQEGYEIWTQNYNPLNQRDVGKLYSIIQTSDEGFAATGYIVDESADIFILKTGINGDSLWTKTYDGYEDSDYGRCIIKRNNNNFAIIGYFHSLRVFETVLIEITDFGETIFNDILNNNIISTCIIETSDNNYVSYYWDNTRNLCKFNESDEILWHSELPIYSSAGGDRGIVETDEGGFLCAGSDYGNYNIKIVKTDSNGQYTGISNDNIIQLPSFNLQTYPTPFNPSTTINFDIYRSTAISLKIYNIKGQLIRELIDEHT
nr:hypothetical protein [Candidatus Cloacimonadota bacterium]